ncbi:MAG: glucodextranase DOMON-like domain-containing protein, partial [Halapricum sp.]
DVPSTTNGRTGLNANFAKPYHYRVVVNGEGTTQVEQFTVNDKGETVSTVASTDVNLSVDGDTISFDLPMEAIGGSPEDKELVSLMAPYDGYGKGGIRQGFAKKPGNYVIGTSGKSTENAPHVMDLVTPDGTSQAQALAYTDSAKAQIPFAEWQKVYVQTETLSPINDAKGDDYGPGTYTYPTSDQIPEGCYDITQVEIKSKTQYWDFTVHVDGPVENPWSYTDGFSPQLLQLYFKDPNAPKDADTTIKGRNGMTSTFQEGYHYRVYVDGNSQMVEDVHGNKLAKDFPTKGHSDNNTITFSLPKAPFDTDDITQMKMAMLVFSQDGYGTGGIRQNFSEKAAQWAFGGVNPDASGSAPRVIDLVGPDKVVDQKKALAYSADSTASIPLTKVEYLMSGEKPNTGMPTAIAPPGPTVFSGNEASLDASNSKDPNGQKLTFKWEQTSGPSVTLDGADTAKPSFTAPDVQEETSLGFKVTVTDPDGNSASATTSATVQPQSDNPAPTVNAKISSGYSQPLQSGDTAAVNAYDSKDPNGGDLSFHWEQTKGPSVSLTGADSAEVFFGVPKVSEETTLAFKVTVADGQGKSTSDSVSVTVAASSPTTTTTMGGTETSGTSSTKKSNNNGSGSGPGFGVVSGALGTAGGIAYVARHLLGDTEAQPEDVTVEDVSDDATVEEEE